MTESIPIPEDEVWATIGRLYFDTQRLRRELAAAQQQLEPHDPLAEPPTMEGLVP